MSKRYVTLLVLAAVLLTAASIALSRRDSQDWRANRSRRLFPFPWQDTVVVDLTRADGSELRFRKSPKGEWLIDLGDDLADSLSLRAVDELTALSTMAWREPIREAKPPIRERASLLTATSAAGQKVVLELGDAANNLRAVTVDGDAGVVYGVNQDLLKFVDWPASRFRSLNLAAAAGGSKPRNIVLRPEGGDDSLRLELRRGDDGWRMTAPVAWPVDETRLDMLLRWVERLTAEAIEAEYTGDLEWFGFGPESTFLEVEYDASAGPVKRQVLFGKETDNGRVYARVEGRPPVFSVSKEVLAEISLDTAASHPQLLRNFYRRRAINNIGDEVPPVIVVEKLLPESDKLTLEQYRDRDAVKWRGTLEKGGEKRTFPVDSPDAADPMRPMTALLAGLSSLRVKTFLADQAPGPDTLRWTAYPAWRFTVLGADGLPRPVLTLYAADADGALPPGAAFAEGLAGPLEMTPREGMPEKVGIAFSMADTPAVMEMFGDLAYLLCLPPYRYQSRRLVDSDPKSWRRVEIVGDGKTRVYTSDPDGVNEQWWLETENGPEPLMDDNNLFVGLLLELSQLRSEGYAAESVAGEAAGQFGLDQPEITAIVYSSKNGGAGQEDGKLLFTLAVGGLYEATNDDRYARLDDSGPVFLLPLRLADALATDYR